MKRDMNIVRKLILHLEDARPGLESTDIDIGADLEVVEYHLRLMTQAGFIETTTLRSHVEFDAMTWAGHDFADACRDDVVWMRTMKQIARKTKSATFDILLTCSKAH